jgi:hypothetical protein
VDLVADHAVFYAYNLEVGMGVPVVPGRVRLEKNHSFAPERRFAKSAEALRNMNVTLDAYNIPMMLLCGLGKSSFHNRFLFLRIGILITPYDQRVLWCYIYQNFNIGLDTPIIGLTH